jgi:hypothetical protein
MLNHPPYTGNEDLDAFLLNVHKDIDGLSDTTTSVPVNLAAGEPGSFLEQYLHVKYANDNVGTGLSDSPTNKLYFGTHNLKTNAESTNPADYTWYQATVPFGTTYKLYYLLLGARQIKFVVSTTSPGTLWREDTGAAINLDDLSVLGTPGADGKPGLSSLTAYRVQSQNAAAPTGFPRTTTAGLYPSGWVSEPPAVAVGSIMWYSFGQMNTSSATIDGIASNTTLWAKPVAASIFQDIRSDNWDGSTPPTFGSLATYGSNGYYIQRSTGDVFFNNGVFRGDIITNGKGEFTGGYDTGVFISVNGLFYGTNAAVFAQQGQGEYTNVASIGMFGRCFNLGYSSYNIGVLGLSQSGFFAGPAYGVMGIAKFSGTGGFFYSEAGVGLHCETSGSAPALKVNGSLQWGSYTWSMPSGTSNLFLKNDGTWAGLTYSTNSGTATFTTALSILGSTSTGIAGAYVETSGSGNTVTLTVQTTSPSDINLKKDIQDVNLGLEFVNKLRPVSYKLKADTKDQTGYGFIAQEVKELVGDKTSLVYYEPDWKVGNEKGFNTIHYPSYIAVLTKAIQELSAKVVALESKLNEYTTTKP